MFCDVKCQIEGIRRFHDVECKAVDNFYSQLEIVDRANPFIMLRGVTESLIITVERLQLLAHDLKKMPEELTDLDVSAQEEELMEMNGLEITKGEQDIEQQKDTSYLRQRLEWLVHVLKRLPEITIDFDLENRDMKIAEMNGLQVVSSLKQHPDAQQLWVHEKNALNMLQNFKIFNDFITSDDDRNFLVKYAARLMQIRSINAWSYQYQDRSEGSGILPFCSLLNHSCDPNVQPVTFGNKFACVVIKPIAEGEQIFINYK